MASNGDPVVSKDHTLNGQKKTHVRIYMPAIKLARNDDTKNRLPAQHHDAMEAILWVREQALNPKGEQWIRDYRDISRRNAATVPPPETLATELGSAIGDQRLVRSDQSL
ncbi:hypothetical protein SO802_016404 [Lithocarpus litseifolius]|uniref:Integrase n=1 Tax=Lithocarpus litseifolius TaxID=425828 RepID=A0AAW2CYP1_9ROSI